MSPREVLSGLPEEVADVCAELFERLPIEEAMSATVVRKPLSDYRSLVTDIIASEPFESNPYLVAGIWLYIDELDRSHTVSQGLEDSTGSYWHAIMHRREGDFWNSKYWLRQMRRHEACAEIDGYDPERLVDMADAGDPDVTEVQRLEWATLFVWCANHQS